MENEEFCAVLLGYSMMFFFIVIILIVLIIGK